MTFIDIAFSFTSLAFLMLDPNHLDYLAQLLYVLFLGSLVPALLVDPKI